MGGELWRTVLERSEGSYRWASAAGASGSEQDGGRMKRKIYWPMKGVS